MKKRREDAYKLVVLVAENGIFPVPDSSSKSWTLTLSFILIFIYYFTMQGFIYLGSSPVYFRSSAGIFSDSNTSSGRLSISLSCKEGLAFAEWVARD